MANLPISQEITNFSKLLAANLKDNRLGVKGDSVYLELDRIGSIGSDDQAYSRVGREIAGKLYPEILLIKSKLVPSMNRLGTFIKELVDNARITPESSKYKIRASAYPYLVEELVKSNYALAGGDVVPLSNTDPLNLVVPESGIRSIFQFSNSTLNNYLSEILDNADDAKLNKVYELYLTNISASNNNIRDLLTPTIANIFRGQDLLLTLAAVDYFVNNKPEDLVSNGPAVGVLTAYQFNLARAVKQLAAIYSNNKQLKKVIIFKDGYDIVVDEELMKEFVSQGGSPDAIFGWSLKYNNTDFNHMVLPDLLANKETLAQEWSDFVTTSKLNLTDQLIDKVKTVLTASFPKIWDEYVPDELKDEINKDQVERAFYAYMKNVKELVLKPTTLARLLMGDVFFSHTNFKVFSEFMVKYLTSDSSITHAQAATFAIVDMIVLYLTNQLTISN